LVGQRILLVGVLGACTAGMIKILNHSIRGTPAILIATTIGGCIAALSDKPTRRWLNLDPQQQVARPRRMIINWAREGLDEEQLKMRMEALLREWNKTERTLLFSFNDIACQNVGISKTWAGLTTVTKEGWITPEALQRLRTLDGMKECGEFLERERLGALLAVPKGSPTPSLFVALGCKISRRPYTYPDIQVLLELAELMDNILTHARVASRMAQIEKMETAAMMSRALAHDLNNLATPVAAFLLHMEPRINPDTDEADVFHDAKRAVHVMEDYIRESLFFTRRLAPNFRPTTAGEILNSVTQLTQPRAEAQTVKVICIEPPKLELIADDVLIQRLLQNLVHNAIDASPQGGSVTIVAEAPDSNHVQFHVTDQGCGIAPEIRNRIFEPYFTTKTTGSDVRGLGLGLAICRKICDLHDGTIVAVSSPGPGSQFTVTLPVVPHCDPPGQSSESTATPTRVHPFTS
jgi:signal transduction histidine kinase